ncbi:tungstate ABC transporter substrate-binding protein WtpA [archaeon]|nr:MAG: tungstate ABC transporter substrate-binding protein WtpA [archaeon]
MNRSHIAAIAVIVLVLGSGIWYATRPETTTLTVICAGSLLASMDHIEEAYEADHPDVDVLIEGHGSIQVLRQVAELGRDADVLAVADYSLIPLLMYGDPPHSDWYIQFATNRLGIAYRPDSAYADEINQDTWYEIFSRDDVALGLSDPRFDASGYRTLMIVQLAEDYYDDPTIFEDIYGGQFTTPIDVEETPDEYVIKIPEILETSGGRISLRGSSVQLLSLLETGGIDYAFEYENVSEYFGLEFLPLPSQIDLGNDDFTQLEHSARVRLAFQRFASITPEFKAHPTIYGLTIPFEAPHEDEARDFVEFLIAGEGRAIFKETYLPTMDPETDAYENLPAQLKNLIEE